MVKGVTHCLLPECSNPTWPFQNYCGRTHANAGKQRGLVRMLMVICVLLLSMQYDTDFIVSLAPVPQVDPSAATQDKDSSLCIMPGCSRKKYVDNGKTHDYCGRTHAEQGKKMGIVGKSIFKTWMYICTLAAILLLWSCLFI